MTYDIRVIARDPKTGKLYRTVCDDDGRIAFIAIDEADVRKGDMRFDFSGGGLLAGISRGEEVIFPQGEHPRL